MTITYMLLLLVVVVPEMTWQPDVAIIVVSGNCGRDGGYAPVSTLSLLSPVTLSLSNHPTAH